MNSSLLIFILNILYVSGWRDLKVRRFSDDFLFGAATAAYQVEGGWDADGKGESIWDRYLHEHPEVIADGVDGDVASDSYHNYKRDVEMLRELGVDFYRFSISWPRILPTGLPNQTNEKGVEYYNNLINELLKYNIQPVITLYHFDLPQKLQDLGGWTNELSVQWFEDYSRVVYEKYADRVKYWITINQPSTVCVDSYGSGVFAPGIKSSGFGDYLCHKNVMLAHAKAYRLYEKEYKPKYQGSVGIALSLNWADQLTNDTQNVEATDLYREFTLDLYLHPILAKSGNHPAAVRKLVARRSQEQGYKKSRLPELSAAEVELLKGSADFIGVNHYTTVLVSKSNKQHPKPSLLDDMGVDLSYRTEWRKSHSEWLRSAPYGLYKVLMYVNEKYDYPKFLITENGWSTSTGLGDQSRADNIREYLLALQLAIEDGSDVMGYTAWSLMDNIEWIAGTSERFGLYEVDFDSEEKTRKPRLSAFVYKRIIQKRILEPDWLPENLEISITQKVTREEL
ncbi:myrosinase 1-like [Aricia agestis]|uniref:myrosinase 1-like n=1 Tax=Aricia agestis TaxID=91739 RepID=UPI001C2046D4|nr:myrosinase 1-like [Aricia agestis]